MNNMEMIKYENKELIVAESLIEEIKNFEILKAQVELKEKQLKEELLKAMETYNITNWNSPNGEIKAIYKKATERKTIDSKRLKDELPDIAEEYSKISKVKSSVALSIDI